MRFLKDELSLVLIFYCVAPLIRALLSAPDCYCIFVLQMYLHTHDLIDLYFRINKHHSSSYRLTIHTLG